MRIGGGNADSAVAFDFRKIRIMRFNLDLLNNFEIPPERESEILKAMRNIYPDAKESMVFRWSNNGKQ